MSKRGNPTKGNDDNHSDPLPKVLLDLSAPVLRALQREFDPESGDDGVANASLVVHKLRRNSILNPWFGESRVERGTKIKIVRSGGSSKVYTVPTFVDMTQRL